MIRRFIRRLVRRAINPARIWITRCMFAASENEVERLRMLRADTIALEQIEQQQMVRLSVRLMAIERGLL